MLPMLFCKPIAGTPGQQVLFSCNVDSIDSVITFRSLDLHTDLSLIHSWITQPYSARYWQLNVEATELHNIYENMQSNPLAHSFIGLMNEKIVCQIDCYHVSAEELKDHVPAEPGDCGLHILMCPPRQSQKGLTEAMLKAFTQFYFSYSEAQTLYGEPDITNQWGNTAAKRAGFQLIRTIQLSYKTANLYSITKKQFNAKNSIL